MISWLHHVGEGLGSFAVCRGAEAVLPGPDQSFREEAVLQAHLRQTSGVPGAAPPHYLDAVANVVQLISTVDTISGIELLDKCPGYFIVGECKNGHRWAKELYCGREWCPVCGEDDSMAHVRRFARWVGKGQQVVSMGYFVFTLPEEVRGRYRSKAKLNELTKQVTCGDKSRRIEGLLKSMGFDRGLARWHWFGDKSTKWHPHLNVIVEAGFIPQGQLDAIRAAWAGILGVPDAVVNYSFTTIVPKMVHILKYVTRATFRNYKWDEKMAGALYNFRNMRSWGKWDGPVVWAVEGKAQLEPIAKLESGLCPQCGEVVKWGHAQGIARLQGEVLVPVGAGYWRMADIPPRFELPDDVKSRLYLMKLAHLAEVRVLTHKVRVDLEEKRGNDAEYQAALWRDLLN